MSPPSPLHHQVFVEQEMCIALGTYCVQSPHLSSPRQKPQGRVPVACPIEVSAAAGREAV